MTFAKAALLLCGYFACASGALMYLLSIFWLGGGFSRLLALAVGSAAAGALFGLSMALYYAYCRRKHRLPSWEALGQRKGPA